MLKIAQGLEAIVPIAIPHASLVVDMRMVEKSFSDLVLDINHS